MCVEPFLLVTLHGDETTSYSSWGGEGQAEEEGKDRMQNGDVVSFRVYSLISEHAWSKEIKRVSIRQGA